MDSFDSIVYLLDTKTGAFGTYLFKDDCYAEDGTYEIWYWSDGNAGCDCNRSIFLYGIDAEDLHLSCNSGPNQIKILAVARYDTGEILWEGDYLSG